MTIDFYWIPASVPSRAVVMTAEHLGIELNKIFIDLFAGEHLKPEFLKLNPQHTVPTINDDGFCLGESRAIQAYLVNKYSPDHPIYPKDPEKRANIDRMLYFDIGTLFKAEIDYLIPQYFQGKPEDPEKLEAFKKTLELFETLLEKSAYAAADHITIADFSLIASLSFAEHGGVDLKGYSKICAWMQKLKKEIPNYHELNDVPVKQFLEFLKNRQKSTS